MTLFSSKSPIEIILSLPSSDWKSMLIHTPTPQIDPAILHSVLPSCSSFSSIPFSSALLHSNYIFPTECPTCSLTAWPQDMRFFFIIYFWGTGSRNMEYSGDCVRTRKTASFWSFSQAITGLHFSLALEICCAELTNMYTEAHMHTHLHTLFTNTINLKEEFDVGRGPVQTLCTEQLLQEDECRNNGWEQWCKKKRKKREKKGKGEKSRSVK